VNLAALIRILGAKGMSADDIADVVELAMPAEPTRAERKQERDRVRIAAKREQERLSRDSGDIARQDDTLSSGSQGPLSPTPPISPNPPNLSQVPPIVPQAGKNSPRKARLKGDFAKFWAEYPLKVGKLKAERAYAVALGKCESDDPEGEVLEGLRRCKPLWDEPDFIPHATTWLNRGGWLDQLVPDLPDGQKSTVIDMAAYDAKRAAQTREIEAALALEASQ
jgi:hypothetical protein